MTFLLSLLGTAASVWVAVWLVDGFEFTGEWWQFLIVAVIVGLANAIVKPIVKLLSLPLIALTLGLFLVVVNALVLQLAVWISGPDVLDLGLTSEGFFWTTFWASIVVSVAGWLIGILLPDDGGTARLT
ncbi:MAG: phage holin family protein [Actinomycetota bacterium]|nr:phage holin family protein [Actinomycetota bacterium]